MFLSLVHDGLTAFRRTGGRAGTQVVPDLAQSLPAPSDGGRTYTFALRPGVRFSTGRTVRPSDVKRGIERSLNAEPAAFGLLGGIASIAADDPSGTIVIRLERPDPDFLYRLALPFAAAVPPGRGEAADASCRPRARTGSPPSTGDRVRLERNRFFRVWSPLAKPDGYPDVIEARFGTDADEAVEAIRDRPRRLRADRPVRDHRAAGAAAARSGPGPRGGVPAVVVGVPQHARAAVRPPRRPPGRQPRDRPSRRRGRLRRPARRAGHLPHPPADLAGLPAGLPRRATCARRAGWCGARAPAARASRCGAARRGSRR